MAGIGYDSTVIVYNSIGGEFGEDKTWYGTQVHKVRVELTQGKQIRDTGLADASVCRFKVYDGDLPIPYAPRAVWANLEDPAGALTFDENTIVIITDKADIGADADAPTGELDDADYDGGLFDYLQRTFGYTYRVTTADHYSLIPHWDIGAR